MNSAHSQEHLRLRIHGDTFPHGHVPISLLAAKLQALQSLLYHAAATVTDDRAARRGVWINRYRDVVDLTLLGIHHSDLVIEMALPESPPNQIPEGGNLTQRTVDLVFQIGQLVQSGQPAWNRIPLRPDQRSFLLRAFLGLAPNILDEYQVELEHGATPAPRRLTISGSTRRTVQHLLRAESVSAPEEERTLTGELIKIHVDVGPQKITIRHRGVEIPCFYPDWLRDQVANLVGGSLVEVTGIPRLNRANQVVAFDRIFGVETVSLEPLRVSRFEYASVRYTLSRPLLLQTEYQDGWWVFHNEPLNLWGWGKRREDALRDLNENFGYLWREFAEESDDLLDDQAKQLKRALLEYKGAESSNSEN